MSLSTLALLLPSLATQSREPFPPEQPLFALHGLGVYGVAHARVADLDGDGSVDVVTAGETADVPLRIHLGNGRGALLRDAHPEVQFPTGGLIRGFVLGDFDGDGDVETAVLTDVGAGSRIYVCDNDGSGAMSVKETLVYFTACDRLAAADVDGDGFDDLVFTRDPNARINVLLSLGAAGFAPPLLVPSPPGLSGPEKYVLGDTTGDGKVDLVSLHGASRPAVFQYVNVGAGSFLSPVLVTQVSASTDSLSLGDTRGDGVLHLVTSDWDLRTGPTLSWYENDGHGSFELRQRLDEARLFAPQAAGAADLDLDGDGGEEWLVWRPATGTERVVAQGDGIALASEAPRALSFQPTQAADFDSDGVQDLLVVDVQILWGPLVLALGNGSGGMAEVVVSPVEDAGSNSELARLDGDGDLDLVSFGAFPPNIQVYAGLGDGRFEWLQRMAPADAPFAVAAGDFDGDRRTDLAVVEGAQRSVEILLQGADGAFVSAGATPPIQARAGGALDPIVLDSDADGRDELALLDPFTKRLFLIGLTGTGRPSVLGKLDLPNAVSLHGSVAAVAGAGEALEVLASGSASFLALWVLEQPLAPRSTLYTERLPLPIEAPEPTGPVLLTGDIHVADFDGDGVRDVWAVHQDDPGGFPIQIESLSSLWHGIPGEGFGPPQSSRSPFFAAPLWAEDLDGDGALERGLLFDPDNLAGPTRLQLQRGAGGAPFGDPEFHAVGDWALGDVDNDGRPDLVGARQNWVFALLNRSAR